MLNGKKVLLFLLVFHSFMLPCHAYRVRITDAPEGDLLTISIENKTEKVRLYGISCPVKGQAFHEKARFLANLFSSQKYAEVTNIFRDADGVVNALVKIEGAKDPLNQQLIAYGMAWVNPTICNFGPCEEWRELEGMAQKNRIGLWADLFPIPPWEWKTAERMEIYQRNMEAAKKKN